MVVLYKNYIIFERKLSNTPFTYDKLRQHPCFLSKTEVLPRKETVISWYFDPGLWVLF